MFYQPNCPCPGTQRQPPDQAPDSATQCPAPSEGSADTEKPRGNATTGNPLATADRQASAVPLEDGEPKNATNPPDAAPTMASVRRDSRA